MGQKSRYPLPLNPEPPDTVCFCIKVPNDIFYLAAFRGAIYNLSKPYAWENDAAHTALRAGARWLQVFNALEIDPNCCQGTPSFVGASGDDFMLRQNPDNPCLLETSVDGVTWCAWADLSKCLIANPAQPTGGGQPSFGSTTCHDFTLNANGKWLLPFQVNEGDIISISDLAGGWNDGTTSWYCPDGNGYALGACFAFCGHSGGDPSATACHMSVIAEIAGNFYPLVGASLTVPAGVTNENLILQANDADLTDNFGTIQGKICVQRPAAPGYALTYDVGSGPAHASEGEIFTITGASYPQPPSNAAYNVTIHISPCAQLEIVASSGWTDIDGVGGAPSWDRFDCASGEHKQFTPANINAYGTQQTLILGVNSVTPFSLSCRLTAI